MFWTIFPLLLAFHCHAFAQDHDVSSSSAPHGCLISQQYQKRTPATYLKSHPDDSMIMVGTGHLHIERQPFLRPIDPLTVSYIPYLQADICEKFVESVKDGSLKEHYGQFHRIYFDSLENGVMPQDYKRVGKAALRMLKKNGIFEIVHHTVALPVPSSLISLILKPESKTYLGPSFSNQELIYYYYLPEIEQHFQTVKPLLEEIGFSRIEFIANCPPIHTKSPSQNIIRAYRLSTMETPEGMKINRENLTQISSQVIELILKYSEICKKFQISDSQNLVKAFTRYELLKDKTDTEYRMTLEVLKDLGLVFL